MRDQRDALRALAAVNLILVIALGCVGGTEEPTPTAIPLPTRAEPTRVPTRLATAMPKQPTPTAAPTSANPVSVEPTTVPVPTRTGSV